MATNPYTQEYDMLFEILKNSSTTGGGPGGNPGGGGGSKGNKYYTPQQSSIFKALTHPDKDIIVQGWETPDSYWGVKIPKAKISSKISLNNDIKKDILPILNSNQYLETYTKGHRMMAIVYVVKEGYIKGSTSYQTKNPGNIGNTDGGDRNPQPTLKAGMELLMNYFPPRAKGTQSGWEFGYKKINQFWSPEIQYSPSTYQRPNGHTPGYEGQYNGEIGYFTKKYAVGARVLNNSISGIATIFNLNGYPKTIDGNTKLKDLLAFDEKTPIKYK